MLVLIAAAIVVVNRAQGGVRISPVAYRPLLGVIAQGESGGNYNAYFGHPENESIRFTEMSVAQVLDWQQSYVAQGSVSSAVGRYQIIRPTLAGLVQRLHIAPQARFDTALQDRLAIALMERRGSVAYAQQKLDRQQFAANLAREWASLPKAIGPDPDASYYAADGINVSRVSVQQVYAAITALRVHK